ARRFPYTTLCRSPDLQRRLLRIAIHRLLALSHAELPLEELRDGRIRRMAHQKGYLVVIVVTLIRLIAGVVLQVVIVRELQLRNRPHLPVEIIEADQVALRKAVADLVDAADQDSQPRTSRFPVGDKDSIRSLQLAKLLFTPQPSLQHQALLRRAGSSSEQAGSAESTLVGDAKGRNHVKRPLDRNCIRTTKG